MKRGSFVRQFSMEIKKFQGKKKFKRIIRLFLNKMKVFSKLSDENVNLF